MPKEKGNTSIQKAIESRWRILIRNPRFFKDIERLQRALFRKGKINEKQVERVADKWGVPQIPWEVIMYCPPINDASYAPFLESCAYKFGLLRVSYEPLAAHRLSRNRFLTLMVDLEHPLDDLVELFKNEVRRVLGTYKVLTTTRRRARKRLDKVDEYLPCWDHAQKGWTLREIAKEVYPQHWAELPKNVEELSIKPTQNEIKEKAKELRQKGQCGYDWSFKQAREDLKEEKLLPLRKNLRDRLKIRRALRQRVWRNIQAAHRLIQDITPQSP